ncbi:MAG: LuxR C-terminal-related transcriptional regulator [Kofleriaceae bacterium]|nr:LuxR C-terminal-related transcriptional regulator [Kofleriaceae bacterium]
MDRLLGALDEHDDAFFGECAATLHELVGADEVHVVPFDTFRGAPAYLTRFTHERRYHGPLLAASSPRLQHGGYIDTEILTAQQRDRMPVYAELLRPLGLRTQLVHLVRFRGHAVGVIHANRYGARGATFGRSALQRMRACVRVLGVALVARRQPPAPKIASLTPREAQVASLAVRGFENLQIAAHLGTSANTVRNQLHSVFRKLDVYSRLDLARVLHGQSDAAVDPSVLLGKGLLETFRFHLG